MSKKRCAFINALSEKEEIILVYDCVKVTFASFTILCGGELCYALFPYVMLFCAMLYSVGLCCEIFC